MKDKIAGRNLERSVPRIRSIKIRNAKEWTNWWKRWSAVTILNRRIRVYTYIHERARVWLVVCKRH